MAGWKEGRRRQGKKLRGSRGRHPLLHVNFYFLLPKHTFSCLLPQSFFSCISSGLLGSGFRITLKHQKEEGKMGTTEGRYKVKETFLVWQCSLIMGGREGGVSAASFFVLMLRLSFIYTL